MNDSGADKPTDSGDPKTFQDADELPPTDGLDRIVLMPRDPEWLHAYWGIPSERIEAACSELGIPVDAAQRTLRVHDVTDRLDPESGRPCLAESEEYDTVELDPSATHWYVNVKRPSRLYCVEYIVAASDGRTISLAVSNLAATPADQVSDATEETWAAGPSEDTETAPPGPAKTKWLQGQDNIHETLSSAGSGSVPKPPEPAS